MSVTHRSALDRRSFLATSLALGAAGFAGSAAAQAVDPYTGQPLQGTPGAGATPDAGLVQHDAAADNRRNVSSFRMHDWQPYFSNLNNGAVLVDLTSRALSYWSEDGTDFRLFPTSIPVSEDLTRRGRTEIIKKVDGPSWSPTPEMKKRNPEWPDFVPPGPDNPMGTHALWLSWTYYRIHGTHDTRKIGRKSSNGCIGLYNEHIQQLFALTKVGTQVLVI
ncbi:MULTISPECIES: L,D-transpeptidase [unclassified Paracoccus (in: a-proteobacteria)]|uniref:L,D-transpeptidase n=1 Tax=unclassified Paracoccus (in: a-proteobacteria) TaxID=2688777 RepID=UPI001602AEB2|nr:MULTISPECIES: L,D-transpeptidase [unclassified Paracoccus (in: a-proteobacteria)]MBB1491608.1 L,D-transpeptidase [Paracoccus sp. MC1854]MBB1498284.1 L,D-transpeptidase [Paracoccus sp. MC1862]QQO44953.1 L,D-transpeptidase [Paracoccus sp. MC1862]